MRRTAKYTAGVALLKSLGAKVRDGVTSNEAVNDSLEERGYWWKAETQQWTNEAKPQRGNKSGFPINLQGNNEQLVQMRVIASEEHINNVLETLNAFCSSRGWQFVNVSQAYTADNGGIRVYAAFLLPEGKNNE